MSRNIFYILFSCFGFVNVNSMAIQGPPLTRYDPCGLGIIHFDRIKDQTSYWGGVIHFGLYSNLEEVETELYFERPVAVFIKGESYNTSDSNRQNWKHLIVRHHAPIPEKFVFHVQVLEFTNETDVPVVTEFILNKVTLCSSQIKASQTISSLNISKTSNQYNHLCGRRSLQNTELVSIRSEAKAGDWPWHVAVLIMDLATNVEKYDCGGNIISRTAVLTAGHCIHKNGKLLQAEQVTVIAGTNNYKDLNQVGRQALLAQELISHPAYTYQFSTSDLSIIKVNKFVYTEYVQPICLWGPAYDKTTLFGKEATMVGFGSTENNTQSEVLRAANIKVQNDSTCIEFRPSVYQKLMNEFTFCAGFGPTSADNPRNGDSGGGLILSTLQLDHRISWFLRGILSKCGVSPGHIECDPTYYVIFTDVGPHYGWISHHSDLLFRINVYE